LSISSREMRALETNAEYYGVSKLQLMENAGRAVADEIAARFKPSKARIAVFCGLGGNGGDGFVAARHLISHGFQVEVVLAGKSSEITDKAAQANWNALQPLRQSIAIHEIHDSAIIPDFEADVVIDALLGIGLKGEPRPPMRQLIAKINSKEAFRLAVDVPSGINSDTGEAIDEAVEADLTITFHKPKPGLEKAKKHAGEVIVASVGLPPLLERFAGPGDVQIVEKPRPPSAHKGDFGRLLVVGGSETFSGAPALVALAAYRAGVDLVHVAAPTRTAYALSSMSADLITIKLEGDHLSPRNIAAIEPFLVKSTAVAMGPGLGLHKDTKESIKDMLKLVEKHKIPVLLDADGLKAFAEFKRQLKSRTVLTPHPGEYRILTGHELSDDVEQRAAEVQKTAQELNCVIVLKGNTDIISDGKRTKLNFTGNPGMTVGGTGDVMSGIIAAFLAQGTESFEAAVAGAFINGAAGDFVASEKGYHMVATDLFEWIPKVINDPMSHLRVRRVG